MLLMNFTAVKIYKKEIYDPDDPDDTGALILQDPVIIHPTTGETTGDEGKKDFNCSVLMKHCRVKFGV